MLYTRERTTDVARAHVAQHAAAQRREALAGLERLLATPEGRADLIERLAATPRGVEVALKALAADCQTLARKDV